MTQLPSNHLKRESQKKNPVRTIAFLGMYLGVALVVSYLENLLPLSVGIPGVKLGLANSVIMFLLYQTNGKEAAMVSGIRIVLCGLLFGNLFSIIYSLAGAAASLLGMYIVKKKQWFTPVGVSVIGGLLHNIAQILVAMCLLENEKIAFYLPVLLIAGTVTGVFIGILVGVLIKKTKNMQVFI